ncbi:MAG: CBS domain-containing protein [Candidatus Thermoplasmatota archaeon]|nr:CBS domain-containing protein [Candidatus Thermoplasmatota archaeon]
MELRDIINRSSPVRIAPDATAAQALVTMIENKTDFLLVDRSGYSDAYGIVTRWDIVEGPIAHGADLNTTPVMDYARKPLVVMNNLDLELRWVAKKMSNENVSKIAVFDKEEFLGFVSDVDIMKAFASKEAKAEKGAGQ